MTRILAITGLELSLSPPSCMLYLCAAVTMEGEIVLSKGKVRVQGGRERRESF